MKKIFSIILTVCLVSLFCNSASAQKYTPKDKWPYVYSEFIAGSVRTSSGPLLENVKLNVSIADGSLHYIKDDTIMKVDMRNVYTAKIGEDVYLNASNKMMKLLYENEGVAVLEQTSVDMDELQKTDIGYGISSSTASTQNVSMLTEMSSDMVNMPLYNATLSKENGKDLPLTVTKYIWYNAKAIPADRNDLINMSGLDKDELGAFIKQNKIKWGNVESLSKLADFLSTK